MLTGDYTWLWVILGGFGALTVTRGTCILIRRWWCRRVRSGDGVEAGV